MWENPQFRLFFFIKKKIHKILIRAHLHIMRHLLGLPWTFIEAKAVVLTYLHISAYEVKKACWESFWQQWPISGFPIAPCQHSCNPVVHCCSNWQTHLYSWISCTRQAVFAGVRLYCVLYWTAMSVHTHETQMPSVPSQFPCVSMSWQNIR